MEYDKLNQKKGVAGLNIFLSLIAMLFMIGIIIMVFVIAGSKLRTALATSETYTVTDTALTVTDNTALPSCVTSLDSAVTSATAVNRTGGTIPTTNYTISGCLISLYANSVFNNTPWNVTYSFTTSGEAGQVINETYNTIDDGVDWFPTFIVLGALVVLILLVVMIINSIKSSGVTDGA